MSKASSLKSGTLTTLLQALADPALTRLEADNLSRAILQCLREIMAADNLAILLLTEDHTALRIYAVLGVEALVARDVRIPLGLGFAGQIVMQGVPLIIHDPSPVEMMTPLLREQLRSLLGVPLIASLQVIGALHVGMKREYLFTDEDISVLQQVAASLTQAFEQTLLVEAGPYEVEELIDAQLSAVVELTEQQQELSIDLVGTHQQIAIDLVWAQQRVAIDVVEAQQRVAIDVVGEQQRLAVTQVWAQLQAAGELLEAQHQTARELGEHQHQAAREGEHQRQAARELGEHQYQTARELVEHQQRMAIELLEAQQQAARELIKQQQQLHLKVLERIIELEILFNAITDAVIVYDEHEHIIHLNQAARSFLDTKTFSTEQNNDQHPFQRTIYLLKDEDGHPFPPERLPLKRLLGGERLVPGRRSLRLCAPSTVTTSSSASLELLYIRNKEICMERSVYFMMSPNENIWNSAWRFSKCSFKWSSSSSSLPHRKSRCVHRMTLLRLFNR